MKLSFILPIFNTGKYLSKCVDSALSQDMDSNDFEILLVYDEGSSDKSLEIAKSYDLRYDNIRLICHSNRSIGESLNYAFHFAKGDFIEIIDTDDYLEPGMIGELVSRMEDEHLDILRINYQNVDEEYHIIFPNRSPKSFVNYSESITDGTDFLNNRFGTACYVPTLIFRRSLLLRPGNEMLAIPINDSEWVPRIIPQALRVSSTSKIVYNYLVRDGSKMHTKNKKRLLDSLSEVLMLYSMEKSPLLQKWYDVARTSTAISIFSILSDVSIKEHRSRYIEKIRNMNVFPLSFHKQTFRNKVRIFLINISPYLYFFVTNSLKKLRW